MMTFVDWITFGIAVAGFVLALVSLAWQVFSWRATGSVVKVKMAYAYPVDDAPRLDVPLYSLTATNRGRLEVSVTGWGLKLPEEGATLVVPGGSVLPAPDLPHTLQPGHEATWYFHQGEVVATLSKRHNPGVKVRGLVRLGNGRSAVSKNFKIDW